MNNSNKKTILKIIKFILLIFVLIGLYCILQDYCIHGYKKEVIWGKILFSSVLSAFVLGFFYKKSFIGTENEAKLVIKTHWHIISKFLNYILVIITAMGIFCCLFNNWEWDGIILYPPGEWEIIYPLLTIISAFILGYSERFQMKKGKN